MYNRVYSHITKYLLLYEKQFGFQKQFLSQNYHIIEFKVHIKQYITCKDLNSKTQYITRGVPQGSILGPSIFLLYVNDLKHVSQIL